MFAHFPQVLSGGLIPDMRTSAKQKESGFFEKDTMASIISEVIEKSQNPEIQTLAYPCIILQNIGWLMVV